LKINKKYAKAKRIGIGSRETEKLLRAAFRNIGLEGCSLCLQHPLFNAYKPGRIFQLFYFPMGKNLPDYRILIAGIPLFL